MMNHNMEKTSPKETYVVLVYYAVHGLPTLRFDIGTENRSNIDN